MPERVAKDIFRDGAWFRLCSVCGEWKRREERNFVLVFHHDRASFYWRRRCKKCRAQDHMIPISRMKKHIDWMIGVVGWNATQRRIGISKGTLYYWTGGSKPNGKKVRRITVDSAKKVIQAAHQLRKEVAAGGVGLLAAHNSKDHCKGCGGEMDTVTEGCGPCWDRSRTRERRLSNEDYKAWERQYASQRFAT